MDSRSVFIGFGVFCAFWGAILVLTAACGQNVFVDGRQRGLFGAFGGVLFALGLLCFAVMSVIAYA